MDLRSSTPRRRRLNKDAINICMALGVLLLVILYVVMGYIIKPRTDNQGLTSLDQLNTGSSVTTTAPAGPPYKVEAARLKPWLENKAPILLVEIVTNISSRWTPLLPGAVRFLPNPDSMEQELPILLGTDLKQPVVFYGPRPEAIPAQDLADLAVHKGYRQAHYLAGGTEDWLEAGLLSLE